MKRLIVLSLLSLAIAGIVATQSQAGLLVNNGFETQVPILSGPPSTTGVWSGDPATIVQAENAITPAEGTRMLRFDGTYPGYAINGYTSGVFQLVDLSPMSAQIAAGTATAELSALFNRVAFDGTDRTFMLQIAAYAGSPSSFPSQYGSGGLANSTVTFVSDADVSTWEQLATSLVLPVNADFLAVQVTGIEDYDNAPPNEFNGNYADAVSLTVVPEPSTLALWSLFGTVGVGIGWWRRRKNCVSIPA